MISTFLYQLNLRGLWFFYTSRK